MRIFKLPSGTTFHSDDKILNKEDLGQFVTLEQMIEDAKLELEQIKTNLIDKQNEEIEAKKQEAYSEALTQFNVQVLALDAEVKALRSQLAKQVLPLALNAAKKIVGEQLKLHPETIIGMIQKQLVQCASCKKVKILVSKEDKEILDQHRAALKEKLDQVESLAIEEAPDLASGSCMILTEAGNINASLELQFKALEAAFQRFNRPS